MKNLYKDYLKLALIVAVVGLILTSCMASRITDAKQAVLVNSEKVKHSTNFVVCIQDKEGKRYSGYWNSHCWNCESASIPAAWNVVTLKNGKILIEPVK